MISHLSAARLWDLPLPPNSDGSLHVTLPRARGRWAATQATVHRSDLSGADITEHEGVLVTTPLRTLLDLARAVPLAWAVAAVDAALRLGLVSVDELAVATGAAKGRGAAAVRAVGRLCDQRAESPFESVLRVTLTLGGLPPPEPQWVITDDGVFVARVDFAWPRLRIAVEADGFAYHSTREHYRSDRERINRLQQLDWRLLLFSWERLMSDPEGVVDEVRRLVEARTAELAGRD